MATKQEKAYKKSWYKANKERQLELNRVYRETHKNEIKAKDKAYCDALSKEEKEKRALTYKRWYETHKEYRAAYMKAYHHAHKKTDRTIKKKIICIPDDKKKANLKIWEQIVEDSSLR